MPQAHNSVDKIQTAIADVIELEALISDKCKERDNITHEIIKRLYSVTDLRIRQCMMLRYVELLSWGRIADYIGVSRDACRLFVMDGINKIYNI